MTFRFDARKDISRGALLRSLLAALLTAGAASAPTGPARAQVYFQPYVQTYSWPGPAQPRGAPFVSRREVAAILYDEGYRLVGPIDYRDEAIVAVGVDDYGRRMRFIIDPDDGAVIGARRLGQQPNRSDLADEDLTPRPRLPRPQSQPHAASKPTPAATPPKEPLLGADAPPVQARRLRQSAAPPPPPGPEQDLAHRQGSAKPVGPSPQSARPQLTAPIAQDAARPEGPPVPPASSAQPAAAPVAQGAEHRAIVPPPGPEQELAHREGSAKPAEPSPQPARPQPATPVAQDASPPASVPQSSPTPASAPPRAAPRPAASPVAHGSAHRALVPPPGAAQAVITPPQSPPAAPPAPIASAPPAAPVVGSTGPRAPSAPAPDAAKPAGG